MVWKKLLAKNHASKPCFSTAWQSLSHFNGQKPPSWVSYNWKPFYFPKVFPEYCWKTKNGNHHLLGFFIIAAQSWSSNFFCKKCCFFDAILFQVAKFSGGQFYIFWYSSGCIFRIWTQKKRFFDISENFQPKNWENS